MADPSCLVLPNRLCRKAEADHAIQRYDGHPLLGLLERLRFADVERPDPGTPQSGEVAADPESCPQISGEGPNIGA